MTLFSGKKTTPQGFSATLSGEAQAVARMLRAGGEASCFRSAARCHPDGTNRRWLDAAQSPATNQWIVVRHEQVVDGSWQEEPILATPYFFDALYEVARFESSELGLVPAAAPDDAVPHYIKVADEAAIPLDTGGLPHPAANGIFLTPGNFDDHAREIAARTRGKKLEPAAKINILPEDLFPAVAAGDPKALLKQKIANDKVAQTREDVEKKTAQARKDAEKADIQARRDQIEALNQPFRRAAGDALNLMRSISQAVDCDFGPISRPGAGGKTLGMLFGEAGGIGVLVACMALFPVNPPLAIGALGMGSAFGGGMLTGAALGGLYDKRRIKATGKFASLHKRFLSAARKLPDGDEKNLALEFARAAKGVFALEQAAWLNVRCEGARVKKQEKLKKQGLKLIDGAAKGMEWPTDKTNGLKAAFISGNFPARRSFYNKLAGQGEALQARLSACLQQVP